MKKFISMVMAAAMVVSLVPATAFAKGEVTATAKIVDALEETKDFDGNVDGKDDEVPELQMKIKDVDYTKTNDGKAPEMDVTVTLDNADFKLPAGWDWEDIVGIRPDNANIGANADAAVKEAQKKVEAAQDALEAAQAAAQVPAATAGRLKAAKAEQTAAATAVTDAKSDLDTKNTAVTTAQEAFDAAETAYYEAVNAGATDVADKKAAMVQAKTDLDTAKTAAATAQTAYDDAVAAKATADAAVEAAQKAVDEATANDANVVAKQAELEKAEKALKDAQNAATVSNVTFKDFKINKDKDELEFTIVGELHEDDIVYVDLYSVMDKTSEGKKATVSVDSKMVSVDDLVYVSILGHGITASTKKLANVAEEEKIDMERDLVIKSNVGDFVTGQVFELKLSKGFEFDKADDGDTYKFGKIDDNVVYMEYTGTPDDEITIDAEDIAIEATTAKSGATATLTVKALKDRDIDNEREVLDGSFSATTSVEIAKVVDYKVELSVDEDEDVPVIYSGVNVDNYGITDDSDHVSLEVTAEETFPGAWSMRKGFNFELPEGVYVTDVDVTEAEYFYLNGSKGNDVDPETVEAAFWNAYQDGSHVNFEFEKRVFDDVDSDLRDKECATMTFTLTLVADPTFEGDVVLKLTGDLVDEQEVTIAKFVKPYTVKAEQNDLKIDYRNTEIPTAITITEAEAGLWAKDEAEFRFAIDRGDMINFEDDATFEVDKDSELEVDDFTREKDGVIGFEVDAESDEAATVTIKDMRLFMQRNIPAGPYDLTIGSTLADAYEREVLFAPDDMDGIKLAANGVVAPDRDDYADEYAADWKSGDRPKTSVVDEDTYVADVCDYSDVVKAAFVNVITGGRDKDDASFTTKVVVPVGESYIISGENQVALDVPAYVSAAGYTMLPVRAVAVALGIDTQNVLWNQPTRTVTILYGQRIITMTAGQKVVYVNGSAIPASASVEITNGRTFLPMRDLATALGVTDITWDAATKTATLNGSK